MRFNERTFADCTTGSKIKLLKKEKDGDITITFEKGYVLEVDADDAEAIEEAFQKGAYVRINYRIWAWDIDFGGQNEKNHKRN